MPIAKVERVRILAHKDVRMELLSSLQEAGIVQLEEIDFQELGLGRDVPQVSHLEHLIHRVGHALKSLSQWGKDKLADKIPGRKPRFHPGKKEDIMRSDYLPVLDQVEKIEAEKNELLFEIRFLEKEKEFLSFLENLDARPASLKSTDTCEILLGSIALARLEALEELTGKEEFWFEVISREKRRCHLLVVYLKKEKDRVEARLKDLEFTPIYFTEPVLKMLSEEDDAAALLRKIEEEIEKKKSLVDALDGEGRDLVAHKENLMLVHDVLHNEREKIWASRLLGNTEDVFYLEGWIRSSDKKALKARLHPFAGECEVFFHPPLPDEEPPVILKNPKAAQPFEVVTRLYGLPMHGYFDPTCFLAPFFFIFVGLTVSEAGYGLLVALISFLAIKFIKPRGGLLLFLKLFVLLGISNVVIGTLVGSWFGFPLRKLLILDALEDPVKFLLLALGFGFFQVWFGTLLNLIQGIRNKNYLQSIFVQGGWLLLLPSLTAYLLTKQPAWGILSLAAAAGIVFFAAPSRNPLARFFGGLYSLYDISRYLSDVLSYSRLLALGLATSVIAMAVNTLTESVRGIPWVGWLLAAVIFIGGHLFNLAISFLGGFVHSMRLQFVEFFSKFFKAGGKPFKPFELEGKFVEFT